MLAPQPSRFCYDELSETQEVERAEKIFAYSLQFSSRAELEREGWIDDCPYDKGYTVLPPPL
jgi:hypothetical protein